jgi:hypothetical protein
VAKLLGDAKVNVVALLGSAAGSQGSVQFVVDQAGKAKKVLAKAGLPFTEGTLEAFEMVNKPGVLAEVTGKLAKKGLNIEAVYATTPKGAKKATLLVAVSQPPSGM